MDGGVPEKQEGFFPSPPPIFVRFVYFVGTYLHETGHAISLQVDGRMPEFRAGSKGAERKPGMPIESRLKEVANASMAVPCEALARTFEIKDAG